MESHKRGESYTVQIYVRTREYHIKLNRPYTKSDNKINKQIY